MRRSAARLLSLLAALAFVLAPVAARAHLAATFTLGLDLCTTPVDGKAPASAAHGDHCECCISATAAPPSKGTLLFAMPGTPRYVSVGHPAVRAVPVPVPFPRGPPPFPFRPADPIH